MNYFSKQIQEISEDRVLRIYGFFLSLVVVLTAFLFIYYHLENWLNPNTEAICWPMFNHCSTARIFTIVQLRFIFYAIGLLSLIAGYLFLRPQWTQTAWTLLIGVNVVKTCIVLMDYRLRLNQHIMAFWIALAFLFLPDKKRTLKILIILFYFWAGVIKIDPEWLTGSALYIKPWFMDGPLLAIACTYVVVLETIFIWSLLWSRRKIAWITFAQLIIFHIFSFKIVGFFYPILMFFILSIFPITWFLEHDSPSLMEQIKREKNIPYAMMFLILTFSFFQILPKTLHEDTSVTGEGRILALHMFDAFTSCKAHADLRMKQGPMVIHENLYLPLAPRIRCDPIVYLSRARNICYMNRNNQGFGSADIFLETKRSTDNDFRKVIEIHDFCKKNIKYNLFTKNDWIMDSH